MRSTLARDLSAERLEEGHGRQLAVHDGGQLLLPPPVGLQLGELELQQVLLGRLVGRDLQRDGARALQVAQATPLGMPRSLSAIPKI